MMNASLQSLVVSEELIRRFDALGPRYTSYPTADRFHEAFTAKSYARQLARRQSGGRAMPLSIYVHLPFCASLCYFCGCNNVITTDRRRSAKYLLYLEREMELLSTYLGSDRQTVQLHLGGGTPTFLSIEELRKLMLLLQTYFDISSDAELGIEIDPRTVSKDSMAGLAKLGFNRASIGVQDFDPIVQQAVNRMQPAYLVEDALVASREAGFRSVNFDLIYGLPRQTQQGFQRTLDEVLRLSPDRIALYNYAHSPDRFKAQRHIGEQELPSADERVQIFLQSIKHLQDAGYVYIGLDHFARADDELTKAWSNHSLQRNFQGYATHAECDLIGLGLSSIGKIGNAYCQSMHTLEDYYAELDAGCLPVEKGIELTDDDQIRRHVIMELMCSCPVDFAAVGNRYGVEFSSYFADELVLLEPYREAGLIELDAVGLAVTPKGRLFVRAIAMVFDKFLAQSGAAHYSKLI